jgi:hypothetical protein
MQQDKLAGHIRTDDAIYIPGNPTPIQLPQKSVQTTQPVKATRTSWLSLSILIYILFKLALNVEKISRSNPSMLENPSYWIMIGVIALIAYFLYVKLGKKIS